MVGRRLSRTQKKKQLTNAQRFNGLIKIIWPKYVYIHWKVSSAITHTFSAANVSVYSLDIIGLWKVTEKRITTIYCVTSFHVNEFHIWWAFNWSRAASVWNKQQPFWGCPFSPITHTHTISNAHTVLELYWIRLLSIVWDGIDHAFTQFKKREKTTIQRPRNERGWKCV